MWSSEEAMSRAPPILAADIAQYPALYHSLVRSP